MKIELIQNNAEFRVSSRQLRHAFVILSEIAEKRFYLSAEELVALLNEAKESEKYLVLTDKEIFWNLYSAVFTAWGIDRPKLKLENNKRNHNEFRVVHHWFRLNLNSLIPNAVLAIDIKYGGYIPDFMVVLDGNTRPVECKLIFNERARNQLFTYMNHFGSSHGYAVAPRLTCELPKNMTFIECPKVRNLPIDMPLSKNGEIQNFQEVMA